ncbi:hypothetical protein [Streptomyces sp. NPDC059894]|uniref:hypothetical protein n=1 Tax=unclassified Streptomyces TaxID=2593676 RepID=UPI0036646A5C
MLGDPSASPPRLRNFARDRFPVDAGPAHLALWPVAEADSDATDATDAAVVSDLRRATGRFPRDSRLAALIRDPVGGTSAAGGPGHDRRGVPAATGRDASARCPVAAVVQVKFTSLHRKYVWSMCDACQMV